MALVAGAAAALLGLVATAPRAHAAAGLLSAAPLFFWIWILWTGVVVWRAPWMRPADAS